MRIEDFGGSEARSRDDEIARDVLRFGRKDVFGKPALQVQIVGDAAKERHRDAHVRIDQAGKNRFTSRDYRLPSFKALCFQIGGVADIDDPLALFDPPRRRAVAAITKAMAETNKAKRAKLASFIWEG